MLPPAALAEATSDQHIRNAVHSGITSRWNASGRCPGRSGFLAFRLVSPQAVSRSAELASPHNDYVTRTPCRMNHVSSRRPQCHGKAVLSPCCIRTISIEALLRVLMASLAHDGTYRTTSTSESRSWNLKVLFSVMDAFPNVNFHPAIWDPWYMY